MTADIIIQRIMSLAGQVKNPRRYRRYLQRKPREKLERHLSDLSADALQHAEPADYGRGKRLVIKHPGPFTA